MSYKPVMWRVHRGLGRYWFYDQEVHANIIASHHKLESPEALYSQLPTWVNTKDRLPDSGMLIVKRWKNGSVWAGRYTGGTKDSSFEEWMELI